MKRLSVFSIGIHNAWHAVAYHVFTGKQGHHEDELHR
jgi:hypothetical protein